MPRRAALPVGCPYYEFVGRVNQKAVCLGSIIKPPETVSLIGKKREMQHSSLGTVDQENKTQQGRKYSDSRELTLGKVLKIGTHQRKWCIMEGKVELNS